MKRLLLGTAIACALACQAFAQPAPEVKDANGALQGVRQGPVTAFLGVPYAAPPVGDLRWRAPQPAADWSGVRDASHFGASCWQVSRPAGVPIPWSHEYLIHNAVSEDCLYLNVWTPAMTGRRPVLVWIHGGGFTEGSGEVPIYDGAHLAAGGIVVVTINYRLGVLGFFAHPDLTREANGAPPANFGLQDMIAALKWVKANIAAFGGDPDQVTIAGQSAGSMAVHDLIASPMAAGLFQRAIAESGLPGAFPSPDLAEAEKAGEAFATSKGAHSIAELRAMPPDALTGARGFGPIVDGVLLPEAPDRAVADGRYNRTPLIVGVNANETSGFEPGYNPKDEAAYRATLKQDFGAYADRFAALYPESTDAQRDEAMHALFRDRGLAALDVWRKLRGDSQGAPVYGYLFDHVEPGDDAARWGAFHSSEIPYAFRTFDASPERPFNAVDQALSKEVSGYWLNFVKTGDPNGDDLPHWPKFTAADPKLMELGPGDKVAARPLLPPAELKTVDAWLADGGKPNIF